MTTQTIKATTTNIVTVGAFTPLGERYYDNHNTYRTGKTPQPDKQLTGKKIR